VSPALKYQHPEWRFASVSQVHFAQESDEPRVVTDWIKDWVGVDRGQIRIALIVVMLEILERLLPIAKSHIDVRGPESGEPTLLEAEV
jgi:hypothetical protein